MIVAGTIVISLLLIVIACEITSPNHPTSSEETPRTHEQIRHDINAINAFIRSECPNPGLSDPRWVCPQVTRQQATMMIASSMAKHIEAHDDTLRESQHYSPVYHQSLTQEIHRNIRTMDYGHCVPDSAITLQPETLVLAQQGRYIRECAEGWNLTAPWLELLSRQMPLPTPNWPELRQYLDPEFMP